jgi:YidC/Oxa1 family membrane protein insertase
MMDLHRLFLFLIFVFSLGMVWDGWQRHQHPERYAQQNPIKKDADPVAKSVPSVASIPSAQPDLITPEKPLVIPQPAHQPTGKMIQVKTDLFEAEINTIGGEISHLALLRHPDAEDKNKPMVLFHRGAGTHNYAAQSGLLGEGLPNHNSLFIAEQEQYGLAGEADQIQVRLSAANSPVIQVTKIITFHKGSYLIDVRYELENNSSQAVLASGYYQLVRDGLPPSGSSMLLPTYTGVAVYTDQEKFQKVDFSEIEKGKTDYPEKTDNGWIGVLQHYFVSAWLPKNKTYREYYTRALGENTYSAGMVLDEQTIAPGQKAMMGATLYAGPAQENLDEIATGLGLAVDYGWLTVLSAPLFWVMSLFFDWTQNWGVAIILLTVLIKLLFFPLSAASYRSMAKMRMVAPKLEKIKQQCGDDREKLNRAMMELYRTEKINPLGGCLPVLVQIPVFIALYWAILASVELRYAPFFGWITDLSAADPYYILPLLMGASMIIQMRLNPKPPDPMQARILQIMPIIFSILFFFFPAGLVLYSIANNILSIGQQWYITQTAESEAESKGGAARR